MGSVAKYAGRRVDLLVYHGVKQSGEVLLQPALGMPKGFVTAGVQKLVQRFIVELFQEQGSRFQPDRGTTFLIEARMGNFRTQTDVMSAFARAVSQLQVILQAEETDADPDDERFADAEAIQVEVRPGNVMIRARLMSRAGPSRQVIFPITIPTIPGAN